MNEPLSDVPELSGEQLLLESLLGPKRMPYNSLIPMTVVYSIIFVTGMVGNCATCIVIAKNQYMQTVSPSPHFLANSVKVLKFKKQNDVPCLLFIIQKWPIKNLINELKQGNKQSSQLD